MDDSMEQAAEIISACVEKKNEIKNNKILYRVSFEKGVEIGYRNWQQILSRAQDDGKEPPYEVVANFWKQTKRTYEDLKKKHGKDLTSQLTNKKMTKYHQYLTGEIIEAKSDKTTQVIPVKDTSTHAENFMRSSLQQTAGPSGSQTNKRKSDSLRGAIDEEELADYERKRMRLDLELLDNKNYKAQLEITEIERRLKMFPSKRSLDYRCNSDSEEYSD